MRAFLLAAGLPLALLGAAPHRAAEHVVTQKDKTFAPTSLTVHPGDKVVFKNEDNVAHNVFSSTSGFAFNLKSQAPGTAEPVSFDKEGTVEVRCAFHPTMKLTVVVAR
jgi:plastocyanin